MKFNNKLLKNWYEQNVTKCINGAKYNFAIGDFVRETMYLMELRKVQKRIKDLTCTNN